MKTLVIALLIIATFASAFGASTQSLKLTISDKSQKTTTTYEVPNFIIDNVSLTIPISIQGAACVFTAALSTDDSKQKIINCSIQNLAFIIPGGGSSSGQAQYILNAWFPFSTEEFKIFTSDTISLSVHISTNSK